MELAKNYLDGYPGEMIDGLVTQVIIEIQRELVSELFSDHMKLLSKAKEKRLTEILPYILRRDIRWKIVRDMKDYLKSDVASFVTNNQKDILELKTMKVKESPAKGKEPPPKRKEPPAKGKEPPPKRKEPPAKGKESPAKRKEPPAKGKEPPPKRKEPPAKGKESPAKRKVPPAKGKESPAKRKEPPAKREEHPAKGKESHAKGKEPPPKRKEHPAKGKESPAKRKEPPAKGKESPANGKEPPAKGKESPTKGKESSAKRKEPPAKGKESPTKGKESSAKRKVPPAKKKEPPAKRKEPPAKGKESPSKGKEATGKGHVFVVKENLKGKKPIAKILSDEPEVVKADFNNICSLSMKLKHHVKVLSYSLFSGGRTSFADKIEVVIRNARMLSLYKDWQLRIYHDKSLSPEKIKSYRKYENVHFCDVSKLPRYGNITNILGKFWRVVPIADPSVDLFCPRDLNGAILSREEDAVREFIDSGMILHTMRDNGQHGVGMLEGMWCFNNRMNRTMGRFYFEQLLEKAKTHKLKQNEPLLNHLIWNHLSKYHINDMVLQHAFSN